MDSSNLGPEGHQSPPPAPGQSGGVVFAVSPDNFQSDVVERSQQVPVLLLFWADQVPPSAAARQQLQDLMPAYQGKALLGLVDVSQDQTLAQHLRVQGLPSIRVVTGGQIADQLDGPQADGAYRELLDRLTLSSADALKGQLQAILDAKDFPTAIAMLQQAINEEPNNMGFRVELADVLVQQGTLDEARTVLASITEGAEQRERPEMRLQFADEALALPDLESLMQQQAADAENLEACYALCVRSVVAGEYEQALDQCMTIVQTDREFREDIGRVTMLRIFTLLGKGHELATAYRRRLFAYLH